MDNKIQPGKTISATLTLRRPTVDGVAGDPYDLTTLDRAYVYVYTKPDRVIAQFAMVAEDGFPAFDVVDAEAGQVRITVPGSKTASLREVQLYVVADARMAMESINLGTQDGTEYEFVYVTSHPNPKKA